MTNSVMPSDYDLVGGLRGVVLPAEDAARLTVKGLRYLEAVLDASPAKGRRAGLGVTAASRLLDWAKWRMERDETPEQAIMALMGGPDKALAWMRQMVPRLEAKARGELVSPEESEGNGEAERTDSEGPGEGAR